MHAFSNGGNQAPPTAVKRAGKLEKQPKDQPASAVAGKKDKENVKLTFDRKGDWSLMTATR